jgi:hypothetical protein
MSIDLSLNQCIWRLGRDHLESTTTRQNSDAMDGSPKVSRDGDRIGYIDSLDRLEYDCEHRPTVLTQLAARALKQVMPEHELEQGGTLAGKRQVLMGEAGNVVDRIALAQCARCAHQQQSRLEIFEAGRRHGGKKLL